LTTNFLMLETWTISIHNLDGLQEENRKMNDMIYRISLIAAFAVALMGCGEDNNGTGGTGGTPTNMAMVRAAHLAPGVPSVDDTAVDILINGEPSGITLEFGQSSGFAELPPGDYTFGIAAAGSTESVLDIGPVTLLAGDVLNAVAYRDEMSDAPVPVAAFVIPGVNAAPSGDGTLYVAHGADDAALDPVDLIDVLPAACPLPILDNLAFGAVEGPLELPAGTLNIGFSLDSTPECELNAGPLAAPVTADVVTIAVAVDTDLSEALELAVYALLPTTEGDIPTLGAPETAQVRIAHLAPEVPSMADTNVDVLVNGNTAITDIEFREATEFAELPVGDYTFGFAAAGTDTPVFEFSATLEPDAILTVVAYRTVTSGGDAPVGVLVFDGSTDGLPMGSGRVIVGHGADDSLLEPVNVLNTGACPPPFLGDFMFGSVSAPVDLDVPDVNIAFSLTTSPECQIDAGPLAAPITDDVVSILVAVDNDVTDNSLDPAIYAIVGDFSGDNIPALSSP
jgi:hypothetical protein